MKLTEHSPLTSFFFFFFHEIVKCVQSVLFKSSENAGKPVLCTWKLGPDGKNSIFPL